METEDVGTYLMMVLMTLSGSASHDLDLRAAANRVDILLSLRSSEWQKSDDVWGRTANHRCREWFSRLADED